MTKKGVKHPNLSSLSQVSKHHVNHGKNGDMLGGEKKKKSRKSKTQEVTKKMQSNWNAACLMAAQINKKYVRVQRHCHGYLGRRRATKRRAELARKGEDFDVFHGLDSPYHPGVHAPLPQPEAAGCQKKGVSGYPGPFEGFQVESH